MSGRPLTPDEAGVIGAILRTLDEPDATRLSAQLRAALVSGDSVTLLHFHGDWSSELAVRHPDGAIYTFALALGDDGLPIGIVTVWISGGYLSSVEYSWYTPDRPVAYPSPERIRIITG